MASLIKYLLVTICIILPYTLNAQQGIKGSVNWISGNQMPGLDKPISQPKPIIREIHIYKAVTLTEAVTVNGVFFTEIKKPVLKKVKSKKNGRFCVKLPPGEYSVFVKEPEGLFANSFDSEGRIQYTLVKKGEFTTINLLVNYTAAY